MVDFYLQLRQQLIDTLQDSLKQVRQILGLSAQELGEIIGLTRQTINNLETKKNNMSPTQYVAICAIIDNFTKDRPDLLQIFSSILQQQYERTIGTSTNSMHNDSFLKKWFLCFPDDSKLIDFSPKESSVFEQMDLKTIAQYYKIFIDESSLCSEPFIAFSQNFTSYLKTEHNKFIVPLKVIEIIQNMVLSSDESNALTARTALTFLSKLQSENLVDIRGEKNDTCIPGTFVSVFSKFKLTNRLFLITQKATLAKSILNLNDSEIGGFTILSAQITSDSKLERWDIRDIHTIPVAEQNDHPLRRNGNCGHAERLV